MATKEELLAQAKEQGLAVPEGATKAEIQEVLDDHEKSVAPENQTPPNEQAAEDIEKTGIQGVEPGSTVNEDAGEGEPDAKSDASNREDQTVAPQADGVDGVDRDHTPAGTVEEANKTNAGERIEPPVSANGLSPEATDEAYEANNATVPGESTSETRDREDAENAEREETRRAEAKAVDTELGTSEEEAAAARNGVQEENLSNPRQNREPKNEFEVSNQKVTEQERQAAQEVSDMTTADREDQAPTPAEGAAVDAQRSAATNQGNEIAQAIAAGFKRASDGRDNFELQPEEGITPRFSLVRNKSNGEVLLRDNGDGTLSQIQLKSLEEKENDLQGTEVEEL